MAANKYNNPTNITPEELLEMPEPPKPRLERS